MKISTSVKVSILLSVTLIGLIEGLPDLPENFFQDPAIKDFVLNDKNWATYTDDYSQRKFTEEEFEFAKTLYLEGVRKREEIFKQLQDAGNCQCMALQIAQREADAYMCNQISDGMIIAGLFAKLRRADKLVTSQEAKALKQLEELFKRAPDGLNKDEVKLRERNVRVSSLPKN